MGNYGWSFSDRRCLRHHTRGRPAPRPERGAVMTRSLIGDKMASMSGLRSIMEDIATSTAGSDTGEWLNLSIGNPASIPEVTQAWQELTEEALAKSFGEASCNYGPSR